MAFAAKYFSKEYVSKQIATLSKALESVSTNLSIMALLGLALVPMVPSGAALTVGRVEPPPLVPAKSVSAPVEVVRAKPVLVPQAPLQSEGALRPPAPTAEPEAETDSTASPHASPSLRVLARVSRDRRRRQAAQQNAARPESGEDGKAAPATSSAKTPVPVPDAKSEAAKADPPEPQVWSDAEIITALKDCLKRLAPLDGAEIEIAPAVKHDQCGTPAPVLLKRIGSGPHRVEFQPPPMINCGMVAGLHSWIEKTLQPAAQEILGSPVVRIRGAAGYACRNRNGTRVHSDRLSEHALANAVDIMGFVTADGRTIDVVSKWGPTARDIREQKERVAEAKAEAQQDEAAALEAARGAAKQARKEAAEAAKVAAKAPASKRKQAKNEALRKSADAERKEEEVGRMIEVAEARAAEVRRGSLRTAGLQKLGKGVDKGTPTTANDATRLSPETTFLRALHKGACGTFGTVLGPEANEAHRNHFHFDLAPRRRRSFCE